MSAAPSTTDWFSATKIRAILPTVVVFPVPFTPTARTIPGLEPSSCSRCKLRSRSGFTSSISFARRISRIFSGSEVPNTFAWVRSSSISSSVAAIPKSASSKVSSISSQSSALRSPRPSTPSSILPKDPDLARRERRRCIRPWAGSGVSRASGELSCSGAAGCASSSCAGVSLTSAAGDSGSVALGSATASSSATASALSSAATSASLTWSATSVSGSAAAEAVSSPLVSPAVASSCFALEASSCFLAFAERAASAPPVPTNARTRTTTTIPRGENRKSMPLLSPIGALRSY